MPACLAFYKPFEVMCQFSGQDGRQTLRDYISMPGVYPAGRLDYRSEGLLLLSDHGPWIHRITDPHFHLPRAYLVQVEGTPQADALERLRAGLVVPGLQTRLPLGVRCLDAPPAGLPHREVRGYHPSTWLEIVMVEGKKHEVRRMTAAVGLPTLRLIRVAIGPITLAGLEPGQWRQLNSAEIARLVPPPAAQRQHHT